MYNILINILIYIIREKGSSYVDEMLIDKGLKKDYKKQTNRKTCDSKC